jgi:hypothetical protein
MATEGARLRVGQGGGSGKKLGSCLVRSDSCVASGLSGRFGHTDMVRAGASGSFGDGCPLGSVSEALPINRSPSDLLRGKLLDQDHRASATRAEPAAGSLGLGGCGRCRTVRGVGFQQLLAEG